MKRRLLYTIFALLMSVQTFAQSTVSYKYDANNRLTKVTYSNGTMVTYTYDELGNRLSKKVIGGLLKGDANNDGRVTITDAVAIVNFILGNASENFNKAAANVNDDYDDDGNPKITITDAVGVVNIILNNGGSSAPKMEIPEVEADDEEAVEPE